MNKEIHVAKWKRLLLNKEVQTCRFSESVKKGSEDLKRQFVETIMVHIPRELLDRPRQCRKERQVTAPEISLT